MLAYTLFLFVAVTATVRAEVDRRWGYSWNADQKVFQTGWFKSAQLGHVFPAGQGSVEVLVPDAGKMASGNVVVSDDEEKVISQIPVPPGASGVVVDLPSKGFYSIKATATYQDGSVQTNSTAAAVIGAPPSEQEQAGSRFGIMHGHASYGIGQLAVVAGARWYRDFGVLTDYKLGADGKIVAPPPGKSHPVMPLTYLKTFAFGLPDWLEPDGYKQKGLYDHKLYYPPTDWSLFAELIKTYAQNTPDLPKYVGVYNEPEATWKGTEADLVKYHSVVAQAVKSVYPGTKILGPCFCSLEQMPQLNRLIQLGLLKDLDGLEMHAYVHGSPEDYLFPEVQELKRSLSSAGRPDFPIYLTEFGWPSVAGCVRPAPDELTRARYVSRSLVLLTMEQIEAMVYFGLQFHMDPFTSSFAILNPDNTPRPAYAAFAQVPRWLNGVTDGRLLRVTPTSYLVLFRKGEGLVAVAWDTKGRTSIAVPQPWGKAEDMMGRAVPSQTDSLVAISPSPVFIEMKDSSFHKLVMLEAISLVQGRQAGFSLPWKQAIVPPPLVQKGQMVAAPLNFPTGRYLVLGKGANGWEGLPVDVFSPLTIETAQLTWPLSGKTSSLQVNVRSYFDHPVKTQVVLKMPASPDVFAEPMVIKPDDTVSFFLPLENLPVGLRCKATVLVETRDDAAGDHREQPVDIAFAGGCLPVAGASAKPDWDAIPPMTDASSWSPFNFSKNGTVSETDCSAILKSAYDDSGLHLWIKVRDDQHVQRKTPEAMWAEDSIQLAFDVASGQDIDSGKHLVFEYGVAKGENGVMVWRWACPQILPPDVMETKARAEVSRKGDVTLYEIFFPWETLGLGKKPKSGDSIGFSLAVNDLDENTVARHGVRLFDGIVSGKDPTAFGRILFR